MSPQLSWCFNELGDPFCCQVDQAPGPAFIYAPAQIIPATHRPITCDGCASLWLRKRNWLTTRITS